MSTFGKLAKMKGRALRRSGLPILFLFGFSFLRLAEPGVMTDLRMLVFDYYQTLSPRESESLPIRLVDIDEESLDRLGQWPWSRIEIARLVQNLSTAGSVAVVLDLLFSETDRLSPEAVARMLPASEEFQSARDELLAQKSSDQTLAEALAGSPAVLGFALGDEPTSDLLHVKSGLVAAGDPPDEFLPYFEGAISSLPVLSRSAPGYGALSLIPDHDGVVRRTPLLVNVSDQILPTIDAEALRVAQGASTYVIKSTNASGEASFGSGGGVIGIKLGALSVPTDANGRFRIRYSAEAPKATSAWEVIAGEFDRSTFANTIVIIGSSAAGLSRPQAVPVQGMIPAFQIRAQILSTLLSGEFLSEPDWARGAEVLSLIILGLLLIWLLPRWGAKVCAGIALIAVFAAVSASWILFKNFNFLITPFYFSIVILLLYLMQSLRLHLANEAEKKQVRHAFGRYLSPVLVDQLAQDPARLKLGGESREITVLFCDIRGFTTISEQLSPEQLTEFLNQFLTPLTRVILEEQGTIDKYMGDCIMAFWNAPLDVEGHARCAGRAALRMLEELEQLNASLERQQQSESLGSIPEIRIGIGINTGWSVAGNLGSEQRFDYSVLGDSVNLASRLEGQSKAYKVDILVSESTANSVSEFAWFELDLVQVVGKNEPVRVFTLLGDEVVKAGPEFESSIALQKDMLRAYRDRQWSTALEKIDALQSIGMNKLGGYLSMMRARIIDFSKNPPGDDWTGVERRQQK